MLPATSPPESPQSLVFNTSNSQTRSRPSSRTTLSKPSRSRSASPVLKTPTEPTQSPAPAPPTTPPHSPANISLPKTPSPSQPEIEIIIESSDDAPEPEITAMPPRRTPPTPPPHSSPFSESISPRAQMTRKSSSAKSSPIQPMQRFYSETPVASTLSGLMNQHKDKEPGRPASATALEHPVQHMPPSPPLTRRSTLTSSRSTTKLPTLARPTTSVIAESVLSGPGRPSSSGSGVSLKEVRRVGKHLGENPIDYLIPHGSLPQPVSGYFHPLHDPYSLDTPPSMSGTTDPDANPVEGIFENLNILLDSYLHILSSGGSLAVGTGYRSVARRLLERVEGMFARDLGVDGAGWAEVLEYVRGARPLPVFCVLPVRGLLTRGKNNKQDEEDDEEEAVAEIAQSVVAGVREQQMPAQGKVEQWLEHVEAVLQTTEGAAVRTVNPLTAEEEAAEDAVVCQIVEGILAANQVSEQIVNFRLYLADTQLINATRLSLSRLYPEHPLETINSPSVALYLLLHPALHPALTALAAVSPAELDLINSGRFDAFLDGSTNVVARDEDEELATLTALDKRLWTVLEGLEDEIETLHTRALVVRRAIKGRRDRIAKKRPSTTTTQNHPSRPPSPVQSLSRAALADKELEDELRDVVRDLSDADWHLNVPTINTPITPEDSASNITFNRRRRRERQDKIDNEKEQRRRRAEKEGKERKRERARRAEDEAARAAGGTRMSMREEGEGKVAVPGSEIRKKRRDLEKEGGTPSRPSSRVTSREHRERKEERREQRREREREAAKEKEKEKEKDEKKTPKQRGPALDTTKIFGGALGAFKTVMGVEKEGSKEKEKEKVVMMENQRLGLDDAEIREAVLT